MGLYTYQHKVVDQITICVANHNGDDKELRNTVLHEAVHIVQACNQGLPIFNAKSLLNNISKDEAEFVVSTYPKDQAHTEIEARVIANNNDEEYVTQLLNKYCLGK
jgi:hypothetical protein